jgi:hypothetical protein
MENQDDTRNRSLEELQNVSDEQAKGTAPLENEELDFSRPDAYNPADPQKYDDSFAAAGDSLTKNIGPDPTPDQPTENNNTVDES